MPVKCHCHAILLSRRDVSEVVLTPGVIAGMVVRLFALSLLPGMILPVVLRYSVFESFEENAA